MEHAMRFAYGELWMAPDAPGIYAWYLRPNVRSGNIMDLQADLTRLASQLVHPVRRVEVGGDLQFQLIGDVQQVPYTTERFSDLITKTIQSDQERGLFAKILNASADYCMSPLYIGVATSLRKRLDTHKKLLESVKEKEDLLHDEFAERSEWMENARNFADRINERRILRTHLYVQAYQLGDIGVSKDVSRKTCEAVETFLNRVLFPPLGRR